RHSSYPVMLVQCRNNAHGVATIVAEPVIEADAEDGVLANHAQRALPQVQALRHRADAFCTDVSPDEKIQELPVKKCCDDSADCQWQGEKQTNIIRAVQDSLQPPSRINRQDALG